jgi:hypothetical protein
VTYSAEFIVNVGQYEHVKLTIEGQDFKDAFVGRLDTDGNLADYGTVIGDYYASLKAAVLYGRDQALNAVKNETVKVPPLEPIPRATVDPSWPVRPEDDDSISVIVEELGATVVSVETVEPPEDAPKKPWERPVKAAKPKAWESGSSAVQQAAQQGLEDF